MKTLRFFGLVLMAILLTVNFSSCDNDDEPSATQQLPVEAKNIVGTWVCIASYYSASDQREIKTDDYVESELIFRADGTGNMDGSSVRWNLKNNKLNFIVEDDTDGVSQLEYTINELSQTSMTLIYRVTEADSDYWEQERIVLKKK